MDNKTYAKTSKYFQACCEAGEIEPHKRQASRFRAQRGKAYEMGKLIIDEKIEKKQIQLTQED